MSSGLTNEEQEALLQFKDRLQDLNILGNPLLEDRRLINWLRARDLKLNDAEAMLRKHLKWRQENNIDTILTSHNIPTEALNSLPAELIGVDYEGNPVVGLFTGNLEFRSFVQKYGKKMTLQVVHYYLEIVYEDVVRKSKDPNIFRKVIYVYDIDGVRLKDYLFPDALDALISSIQCLEANYPELLLRAYVLNAPAIFPMLYNIVKPFLAPKTLSKIRIHGYSQEKIKNSLLEQMPESQFMRKWGGTGYSKKIPILNTAFSPVDDVSYNDFTHVKIRAGDSFEVIVEVEQENAMLSWSFTTKHHDIGFCLLHRPHGGETHLEPVEMVGYKRFSSQKGVQSGSLVCNSPGQYVLRFDNMYSRLREKSLMYNVELTQLVTGNP